MENFWMVTYNNTQNVWYGGRINMFFLKGGRVQIYIIKKIIEGYYQSWIRCSG